MEGVWILPPVSVIQDMNMLQQRQQRQQSAEVSEAQQCKIL